MVAQPVLADEGTVFAQVGEIAEQVRSAVAGLAALVATAEAAAKQLPRTASGLVGALRVLDSATSVLSLQRARVATLVRNAEVWSRSTGARSHTEYRAQSTGQGLGAARQEEALGKTLELLPRLRDAGAAGEVSEGHIKAVSSVLDGVSEPVREKLAAREEEILQRARRIPVPQLRRELATQAAALQAEAADASYEAAHSARYLRMTRRGSGMRFEALLDVVAGEKVRAAIDAVTLPPAEGDTSTSDQRRADALTAMAARVLTGPPSARGESLRPQLTILLREDTWLMLRERQRWLAKGGDRVGASGAAFGRTGLREEAPLPELLDGTLVPFAALDALVCDAWFRRVVLDPAGVPLNVGERSRTFTRALREAVLVRDRHCQWPGCALRAEWCEVHHLHEWGHGGVTSLDNAITLCDRHHHSVHSDGVQIRPEVGGFRFVSRDGSRIGRTTRLGDELLVPRRRGDDAPGAGRGGGSAGGRGGPAGGGGGPAGGRGGPGGGADPPGAGPPDRDSSGGRGRRDPAGRHVAGAGGIPATEGGPAPPGARSDGGDGGRADGGDGGRADGGDPGMLW